jgi:hypothetical protein
VNEIQQLDECLVTLSTLDTQIISKENYQNLLTTCSACVQSFIEKLSLAELKKLNIQTEVLKKILDERLKIMNDNVNIHALSTSVSSDGEKPEIKPTIEEKKPEEKQENLYQPVFGTKPNLQQGQPQVDQPQNQIVDPKMQSNVDSNQEPINTDSNTEPTNEKQSVNHTLDSSQTVNNIPSCEQQPQNLIVDPNMQSNGINPTDSNQKPINTGSNTEPTIVEQSVNPIPSGQPQNPNVNPNVPTIKGPSTSVDKPSSMSALTKFLITFAIVAALVLVLTQIIPAILPAVIGL